MKLDKVECPNIVRRGPVAQFVESTWQNLVDGVRVWVRIPPESSLLCQLANSRKTDGLVFCLKVRNMK